MNTLEKVLSPKHNPRTLDLLPQLTAIARSGFGTAMTEEDVRDHVLDVDFTYLLHLDDTLAGFSSYKVLEHEGAKLLYLSGIVVDRSLQKHGLFYRANTAALAETRPDYLVMRTQNPVIYGATKRLVRTIYPNGRQAPDAVVDIAKRFGGPSLDPETFIVSKIYGTCLYDRLPSYDGIDEYFRKLHLDHEAGDALIIVGEP